MYYLWYKNYPNIYRLHVFQTSIQDLTQGSARHAKEVHPYWTTIDFVQEMQEWMERMTLIMKEHKENNN